jgi:hypothetical protein
MPEEELARCCLLAIAMERACTFSSIVDILFVRTPCLYHSGFYGEQVVYDTFDC